MSTLKVEAIKNPASATDTLVLNADGTLNVEGVRAVTPSSTSTLTNKTIAAATNTVEATSGPSGSAFSFRNKIINGGFDVWQRSTSASGGASAALSYVAPDRWMFVANAFNANCTISRQTGPTAQRYCVRLQRNNGDSSISLIYAQQTIETANSIWAQGKTVTLSFQARCGALYNAGTGTGTLQAVIRSGTGTDQTGSPIGTAFTGAVNVTTSTKTVTTTWQTFTVSGSVGASATQLSVDFTTAHSGTAGATDYVEITGVQLEAGSVATPFEARPYGLELVLCQRYYYRDTPGVVNTPFNSNGMGYSTTQVFSVHRFPVTMRVSPTSVEQTGVASDYKIFGNASYVSCSSVPTISGASKDIARMVFTCASGIVVGHSEIPTADSTSAYLGWSAEL
jgi:hypothetical protein